MLLKKIIFNNYKTFYGHQEIDFYIPKEAREEGKNIILVGGLNGTGKTTILKAILYVLFGKRGISDSEHERLFSNVINNTFFNEGGNESSVSLIIETDSGEEWNLIVRWYFDRHSKRLVHEERELYIRKPGIRAKKHALIENIEVYNKFIDRIIPYHAAPFFIFDGEEIKEIILRQNSKEMKDAIHKITGMETHTQLINDLIGLNQSLERKLINSVDNRKLEKYKDELAKLEKEIKEHENRRIEITKVLNKLNDELDELKEKRNKKISQNSSSRETLIKKQTKIKTELQLAKNEFNIWYKENIINILLAEKIKRLKHQINIEKEIKRNRIIEETALKPYKSFINQLLSKKIEPPLSEKQLEQLINFGQEIWKQQNNINTNKYDNVKEIHDLSSKEEQFLLNYPIKDKNYIVKLLNKIENLENEVQVLEEHVRSAPETVDIEVENKKIDMITKKIGAETLKLNSLQRKIRKLKDDKSDIQNKLTRLSSKVTNLDDVKKQHELLNKTLSAMKKYIEESTTMKAQFIQEEFSSILNKLFRKEDEFGKIEFDIDTYTIRLFNDKMQEISIQDRSAGEMQMISSSLIWALTKVSDLSLPIVVDTPLGRLDSEHRNHLIKHYYKEISEQVIILSTDTEITDEYIELMNENSYKQFLLDYDEENKYTRIRNGYFDFVKE